MSANDRQVNGEHYKVEGEQHWDRIWRLYGRGYFVGCATKYIERHHLKNGKEDLLKAIHFLEKLIELEYPVSDRHPADYQELLSEKMTKMRLDAMAGIPDHLREIVNLSPISQSEFANMSPMLQKYFENTSEEPLSNGYVNQDPPYPSNEDKND